MKPDIGGVSMFRQEHRLVELHEAGPLR
jgi:hypothetical protein